jgi:hypothetical protein
MGPKTLRVYALQSYGVEMTLAEAKRHKATFFNTYPGLDRWHRRTDAERAAQTETRTLAGRRRLLDPKTPIMHRLNSPVLGTEADAAKTALALLWERRDACRGCWPLVRPRRRLARPKRSVGGLPTNESRPRVGAWGPTGGPGR